MYTQYLQHGICNYEQRKPEVDILSLYWLRDPAYKHLPTETRKRGPNAYTAEPTWCNNDIAFGDYQIVIFYLSHVYASLSMKQII